MTLSRARGKLLARLGHRKAREREGLFLVEGIRSVADALSSGADISFGLVAPRASELAGGRGVILELEAAGVELHEVGDAELGRYADTEVTQGLLLVCREPTFTLEDLINAKASNTGAPEATTRLLVLDGVQDPGNAGTLLRAAAAFGLQGAVFLDGSVDPYNAKVVRASAGGVFRVPVLRMPWPRLGPWVRTRGLRCLVADSGGGAVSEADRTLSWALVIGSEGSGVRGEIRDFCDGVLGVPMAGGTESLNAAMAGSILLYVLTRGGELG